jgi:sulfatase maturation enzyme AslB (radical SAM superfamily)
MDINTFCVVPFLGGCIRPNGQISVCCQSRDPKTADHKHIVEWFTSAEMDQLRKDLYDGNKHPWCQRCWTSQDLGQQSLRQIYNKALFDQEVKHLVKDSAGNGFKVDGGIHFLDLKLGNLCNLKCMMCSPESSSKIQSEWKQHREWFPLVEKTINIDFTWPEKQNFRDLILPHVANMKYVKFTGGEPMLNPYIDDILKTLPDDCLVHITTNLTVLDDRKITQLKRFKNLWISASVDAVERLYEIIRYPGKWKVIEQNVAQILDRLPNANFSFSIALSALAMLRIDETINHLKNLTPVIGLIIVDAPSYMTLNTIPDKWIPKINDRVSNIKDQDLRKQIQSILAKRTYCDQDHEEYVSYVQRISRIRKIKIDPEDLLYSESS